MNGHAPSSWMPAAISVTPCLAKDCAVRSEDVARPTAVPRAQSQSERIQAAVRGFTGHAAPEVRPANVGIDAGSGTTFPVTLPKQRPRGPLMRSCNMHSTSLGAPSSGVGIGSIPLKARKPSPPSWRDGAVRIAGRVIPAIRDPANASQSEALKAKTKHCGTETSAVALRSERVRSKNIMPITASRGWRGARRHASVESPRER
jgi:hypothetical protein